MASLESGSSQHWPRPASVSSDSRRSARVFGGCLGVCALGSFACASGDPQPDGLGQRGFEWCAASCASAERCDQTFFTNCPTTCQYNLSGYFRRVTPDAITAETECFNATTECPETLNALFSSCAEQASLVLPLSAGAENFCAWMAEPFFECAWFDSPDRCAESFSRFTPEALTEGVRCADAGCDQLSDCLANTLGTYGER